jgi:hypothetical protein
VDNSQRSSHSTAEEQLVNSFHVMYNIVCLPGTEEDIK